MAGEGCTRILAAPLYPQYCAATTASAVDAVFGSLAAMRRQPALRTLPPYYDQPAHIAALNSSIERQIAALDFEPQRLLLSFHGMPQRTLELGDPYHCHCQKTARLLSENLNIRTDIAFQSRFGRAKWLEPATDKLLAAYPGQGVKRIAIAAPGFSADCVETVEELGIRGRETFLAAGGTHFARLECLNDSAEGMDMLEVLIGRELAGWLPQP
jgi:ferrochelatase